MDALIDEETPPPAKATLNLRLPKVNGYDVEMLGRDLRLKLLIKRIPYTELDDLVTPNEDCTIRELLDTLQREPFSVD